MGGVRVVGIWLVVGACFSPTFPEGAPCASPADCPGDLMCDPGSNTCVGEIVAPTECDPGFAVDGSSCVDIDECATGNDCSADGTCSNTPGSFTCACNAGFEGDGRSCARICTAVVIYDDCVAPDTDCATLSEALFADNAAAALGLEVKYGGVADQPAFRTLLADGGFELVIVDSSLSPLQGATADAVAAWIDGGGRTILNYWDLDNANEGATLRAALQVDTVGSFTVPKNVVPDPAASIDIFASVPLPLTFTDPMVDDGDDLALAADGEIIARHTDEDGPAAITLTRGGRAFTMGFMPVGMVFQTPRDTDNDGVPDVQELYQNLIGQLCGLMPAPAQR